jgi:hypothetical protein
MEGKWRGLADGVVVSPMQERKRRGPDEPRAGEPEPGGPAAGEPESDAERRRRRALFLRELTEARELRERVQPRRARAARMRRQLRMRTFRW